MRMSKSEIKRKNIQQGKPIFEGIENENLPAEVIERGKRIEADLENADRPEETELNLSTPEKEMPLVQ